MRAVALATPRLTRVLCILLCAWYCLCVCGMKMPAWCSLPRSSEMPRRRVLRLDHRSCPRAVLCLGTREVSFSLTTPPSVCSHSSVHRLAKDFGTFYPGSTAVVARGRAPPKQRDRHGDVVELHITWCDPAAPDTPTFVSVIVAHALAASCGDADGDESMADAVEGNNMCPVWVNALAPQEAAGGAWTLSELGLFQHITSQAQMVRRWLLFPRHVHSRASPGVILW